jgi:hypothetical protein
MAYIQTELAGNLILGAAMLALAATVALRSQDREARVLAPLFLGLFGLSLAIEGIGHLQRILGHDHSVLQAWSELPAIAAGPLLAAYAVRTLTGRRLHLPLAALALPLLAFHVALMPGIPSWLGLWRLAQEAAWCTVALAAAFLAYMRAAPGPERDRAEAFLVPAVLLAFPVLAELAGAAWPKGPDYSGLPRLALLLAGLMGLLCLAMAFARAGRAALRPLLACTAFLAPVAAVWMLYTSGVLAKAPGGPIWSVRWFVLLLALAVGISGYGLWSLRGRAARHAGRAAALLVLAMATNQAAGILLVVPGITPAMAVGAAVALALLVASTTVAVRWAGWAGPADPGYERMAHLRAAALVCPERAERVRRKLRLPPRALRLAGPATARPASGPIRAGDLFLGRYDVRRLAGTGAQGEVFEAWDRRRGVPVVLKRFRSGDPGAAREARSALGLRHPHLAGLLEVEPSADGLVLVLEHVEGQTLWERLARHGPDGRLAAVVARDIGRALRFLHGSGLVHGDVKPDNIMLRPDGRAVLIDCGASRPGGDPREVAHDWGALQAVVAGCSRPAPPAPTLA